MSRAHLRYCYLATLADWSEIEKLLRASTANNAESLKADMDRLVDEKLSYATMEQWATILRLADKDAEDEVGRPERDAMRYRWLCNNNFDRDRMQIITYQQWTEPHSQTGEPQPWSARVRGSALDRVIDEAMAAEIMQVTSNADDFGGLPG